MVKRPVKPAEPREEEGAAPIGPHPFGRKPLKTFTLVIGLPALAMYLASGTLMIFVLLMMATEIDKLEDTRGIQSMHAALDTFLNGLGDAISDEGTWNEAYLNTVVNSDPAWMDTTWGTTARIGQSYDTVLVTDQFGEVQFGENNLGAIRGNIASHFPAAKTMLIELDKGISATGDATVISQFAADETGAAGLAAISIHQSTANEMSVPPQTRRVLWIAKHVTPTLLQDFATRYQTPLASLTSIVDVDSSSIDLVDADGTVTGTVAWTPDRPGDAAFSHALLIASGVYFAIGALLALGMTLLRRAIQRRAGAVEAAFVEGVATPADDVPAVVAPVDAAAEAEEETSVADPVDGVIASDFEVEYQPVFDLRAETLVGVEALLRWRRPDKTRLLQEELDPQHCARLYDRAGLIALRHAAGEIAPLLGLTLTIVVSPAQLLNSVFAEKVIGTLGATNFPARRLQFSIDTSLLKDLEPLRAPIAAFRQSGISIALANFALGPATADYLAPGVGDRLRLAASSVAAIESSPSRQALIEATISAAKAANFGVSVSGLERKEDAARLLRLGCRDFQGNFLAKPMAIAALTQLILAPARPAAVKRAS